MNVEKIKEVFPNPTPACRGDGTFDYCVGGALCNFLGTSYSRFPSQSQLTNALRVGNEKLSREEARHYAFVIIQCNDNNKMELAWKALYKALTHEGSHNNAER